MFHPSGLVFALCNAWEAVLLAKMDAKICYEKPVSVTWSSVATVCEKHG